MLKNKEIFFTWMLVSVTLFGLSGCAFNKITNDPQDPYEHFNRKAFAFNMAVDKAILRPVAKVYDTVLPWPVKKGVQNIFSNVGDVSSAANEVLQTDFTQAVSDLARVVINTTIGIGGLFDVATKLGIEKDYEDFGLTLAKWGAKNTPYLVLPFFGPSTVRDAIALPVQSYAMSVWTYVDYPEIRYSARALELVQKRAVLLPGDKVIEQAFDPYVFIRDAYLQRRAYLIDDNEFEREEKFKDEYGVVHRRHQDVPTSSIVTN